MTILARLRAKLTYANVVATLALFLGLGGGIAWALAANSVKSKHIVNGQVKSADVKDDGVTGTDINESSLGEVPRADLVDGIRVQPIHYRVTDDVPHEETELLNLGGLRIAVHCLNPPADNYVEMFASTTVANATINVAVVTGDTNGMQGDTDPANGYSDNDFDPGDSFDLSLSAPSYISGSEVITAHYSRPGVGFGGPSATSVFLQADSPGIEGNDAGVPGCVVSGFAMQRGTPLLP